MTISVVASMMMLLGQWPQWGGPGRDFHADGKGLAETWPAAGPRKLWSRPLGEGYSSIAVDAGALFTMYRRGGQEVVVCLDADTGATRWEFAYDAPFTDAYEMREGPGPHATPLVAGNLVFTAGATAKLHALEKRTGRRVWSHDLIAEFGGTIRPRGYSSSPLAWKDTILVMAGGAGNAVLAFRQKDGSVAWKSQSFRNSPSSPMIIRVDGQDQLVAFLYGEIVGLNPDHGELLWQHAHPSEFGLNISTPIWGPDNVLFISSAYGGGARGLELRRQGGGTVIKELWAHRAMRIHFGNAIRVGDHIYGSSGDFGPTPFTCLEARTGKILWRDRALNKTSFLYAGGRFLMVEEDGDLILASPGESGLRIHARAPLLAGNAWTGPALAGTRLYLRDRKVILAVDLQ